MSSKAGGWKRDNLRVRFPSARSIEETGLDSSRYREDPSLFSPHLAHQGQSILAPDGSMSIDRWGGESKQEEEEKGTDASSSTIALEQRRKKLGARSFRSPSFRLQEGKIDDVAEHAKAKRFRVRKGWKLAEAVRRHSQACEMDSMSSLSYENLEEVLPAATSSPRAKVGKDVGVQVDLTVDEFMGDNASSTLVPVLAKSESDSTSLASPSVDENSPTFPSSKAVIDTENAGGVLDSSTPGESLLARNRWRRLRHTVAFATHMAHVKNSPNDLLEEKRVEELNEGGAGGVGAAAFEGSKTGPQHRLKGRKGMEGLVVRQDKSLIGFVQDFYVACLKMSIGYFLVGVFLAPMALSLLFMPLFLLNIDGLTYDEAMAEQGLIGPLASAKETCLAVLNVFLYALSLSTTFGGSPVIAVSPYSLLIANVNTLMAQFLFVFLSGAVFARMSQPSHPIRCSKKAIIKKDDYIPSLGDGEKFRVLSIRLVLTGPPPCELVDAKICLTFRIFVTLPSGSVFCSTQDLDVVRPEVSYLRYGLMVRHIIDKKSPVYGHTNESLVDGDASFSLTVMGLERASMQPIFHLEDYFVHDGDVVWDADYVDFIQINDKGLRVLDHSKIDLLKTFKAAGTVSQAVARMKRAVDKRESEKQEEEIPETVSPLRSWASGIRNRKLWKCMSSSFTRAETFR
ncbi:uncharacterized protein LOC9649778 [Selaginella moellendorffii]|uniref:uncharacterized protein LOC9649778 n=1 Tax=Selaginella moellendorffii TaxID=88036 RepID=UPI000D1CF615|nr:uncharacterized protein LOC9649778 [Selaginella moellendorffii]|eukprot:XP_024537240.1 uncharacterized protein LOC9649778 [Selaginella moellendorffii]